MLCTVIIQLMLDMTTHAFSTASANQPSPAIPARVVLRTYAALYPIAQSALIKLAKMRGHLYEEITDQCLTTSHLHDTLTSIACNAKVFGLEVTNGELFSGPTDNPSDKWLPAVQLSKSPFEP